MLRFTLFVLLSLAPWFGVVAQDVPKPADLVLTGGIIYTVDEENSVAEALAVSGDRIVAVGRVGDIERYIGAQTRVIGLRGRTVVPGFIDAHGHLLNLGMSLRNLDLVGTKSLREIVQRVADKVERVPNGEWIIGRGWDQNDWENQAFPENASLNEIAPTHPVYLTRVDGHAAFVNEAALEIAGITRDTPDPDGGRIYRDASGSPTGVLVDSAQNLVKRHIPKLSRGQKEDALQLAIAQCLRHGLTSVHDAGVPADLLELYKDLIDANRFELRVYAMIASADVGAVNDYFETGPLLDYGAGRLTVRSIKVWMDGALGSRGAALLEEYTDDAENAGLLFMSREKLQSLVERALAAGFQVATHAIGDRANRMTLDAYEIALKAVQENDARLRIEHAQVIALEDIPRFAKLGVIASMQATHATSDMYWAEARLGPQRVAGAYAWRKLMDSGVRIANGSDFPVEHVNPIWGFYAAVTRQDHEGWPEGGWYAEERMARTEALRSFTIDAAYAAFEEGEKGSIETGKLADLVILSKDIMRVALKELLNTHVELTMLGGKIVYEE